MATKNFKNPLENYINTTGATEETIQVQNNKIVTSQP